MTSKLKNRIQVIVIEDDILYRESLQEIINESEDLSCGHTFESCEKGIAYLEEGDAPQIILLDIQLPGISGIEGIKKLLAISPSTKIIILTVWKILKVEGINQPGEATVKYFNGSSWRDKG